MPSLLQSYLICATFLCTTFSLKLPTFLEKRLPHIAAACIHLCLQTSLPMPASAGMLTFPLPAPFKNNFMLIRAGECSADSQHEIQTNPVRKLRQDNALTLSGQDQAVDVSRQLEAIGFLPTYIWVSNTERAYETAVIIARESQVGQNRIVPVYSDLDARSIGTFEGSNDEESWKIIHKNDEINGINYKPPAASDGTPNESVADVLVRANQLVSTIESMYSGENVLIISPDSDNLSVLQAALSDEDPDASLPKHSRFSFKNGEMRELLTVVKPTELLVTGQTQDEADIMYRKMKALRVGGNRAYLGSASTESWVDLWHLSIDNSRARS